MVSLRISVGEPVGISGKFGGRKFAGGGRGLHMYEAGGGLHAPPNHPGVLVPNAGIEQPTQLGMLCPFTNRGVPMNPNIAALGKPSYIKAVLGTSTTPVEHTNKLNVAANNNSNNNVNNTHKRQHH